MMTSQSTSSLLRRAFSFYATPPRSRPRRWIRVQRSVDGDQEVAADELVELEVMHAPLFADLGAIQDDEEDMIGIDMNTRDVVAVPGCSDRHRVEAELLGEQPLRIDT